MMRLIDYLTGQYKYRVMVFKPRGDKVPLVSFDKAKKIDKAGVVKYELYKHRKAINPPKNVKTLITEKGQDVIMKVQLDDDTFSDMSINLDKEAKGILESSGSQAAKQWSSQQRRRTQEMFNRISALERYGPLIGLIFISIILAFVAVYGFNTFTKLAGINQGISAQNAETAALYKDVIQDLNAIALQRQTEQAPILGRPA